MAERVDGRLDRAEIRFIRNCMRAPYLDREREQALALAWRDRRDQSALGELILAQYLVKPAFAPYMAFLMQQKAYEPAALAIVSFALTWACMGVIQLVGRGGTQAQIAGGH